MYCLVILLITICTLPILSSAQVENKNEGVRQDTGNNNNLNKNHEFSDEYYSSESEKIILDFIKEANENNKEYLRSNRQGNADEDNINKDNEKEKHSEDNIKGDQVKKDHVQVEPNGKDKIEEENAKEEGGVEENHANEHDEDKIETTQVHNNHMNHKHVNESEVKDRVDKDHIEEKNAKENKVKEDHDDKDNIEEESVKENQITENTDDNNHIKEEIVKENQITENQNDKESVKAENAKINPAEEHKHDENIKLKHSKEDYIYGNDMKDFSSENQGDSKLYFKDDRYRPALFGSHLFNPIKKIFETQTNTTKTTPKPRLNEASTMMSTDAEEISETPSIVNDQTSTDFSEPIVGESETYDTTSPIAVNRITNSSNVYYRYKPKLIRHSHRISKSAANFASVVLTPPTPNKPKGVIGTTKKKVQWWL